MRGETDYRSIEGGLPDLSVAYLARLDGPVLETELPYLSFEALSNDAGTHKTYGVNFVN